MQLNQDNYQLKPDQGKRQKHLARDPGPPAGSQDFHKILQLCENADLHPYQDLYGSAMVLTVLQKQSTKDSHIKVHNSFKNKRTQFEMRKKKTSSWHEAKEHLCRTCGKTQVKYRCTSHFHLNHIMAQFNKLKKTKIGTQLTMIKI